MTRPSKASQADVDAIHRDFTSPNPNSQNPLKRVQDIQGRPTPVREKRPKGANGKSPSKRQTKRAPSPPTVHSKHQPSPSLANDPLGWTLTENRKGRYKFAPMKDKKVVVASKNQFAVLRPDTTTEFSSSSDSSTASEELGSAEVEMLEQEDRLPLQQHDEEPKTPVANASNVDFASPTPRRDAAAPSSPRRGGTVSPTPDQCDHMSPPPLGQSRYLSPTDDPATGGEYADTIYDVYDADYIKNVRNAKKGAGDTAGDGANKGDDDIYVEDDPGPVVPTRPSQVPDNDADREEYANRVRAAKRFLKVDGPSRRMTEWQAEGYNVNIAEAVEYVLVHEQHLLKFVPGSLDHRPAHGWAESNPSTARESTTQHVEQQPKHSAMQPLFTSGLHPAPPPPPTQPIPARPSALSNMPRTLPATPFAGSQRSTLPTAATFVFRNAPVEPTTLFATPAATARRMDFQPVFESGPGKKRDVGPAPGAPNHAEGEMDTQEDRTRQWIEPEKNRASQDMMGQRNAPAPPPAPPHIPSAHRNTMVGNGDTGQPAAAPLPSGGGGLPPVGNWVAPQGNNNPRTFAIYPPYDPADPSTDFDRMVKTLPSGTEISIPGSEGWPNIHFAIPLLGGHDSESIEDWEHVPGPKLLIRKFKGKFNPAEPGKSTEEMKALIGAVVDIAGARFHVPVRNNNPTALVGFANMEHHKPPFHSMISGLKPSSYMALYRLRIICTSTEAIVIERFEDRDRRVDYMFTLRGAQLSDSPEDVERVRAAVHRAWHRDPSTANSALAYLRRGNANTVRDSFSRMWVEALKIPNGVNSHEWVWNVFAPALDMDFNDSVEWNVRNLRGLKYIAAEYGMLEVMQRRIFLCVMCKSLDHPSTACPFLDMRGWLYKSIVTERATRGFQDYDQQQNAGRGRYSGRGGRSSKKRGSLQKK